QVAGTWVSGYGHNNYSKTSRNWIIRKNQMVNSANRGIIISGTNYQNIYIYNNTLYQEANAFPQLTSQGLVADATIAFSPGGVVSNGNVKNNIGYGVLDEAPLKFALNSGGTSDVATDYNLWTNLTTSSHMFLVDGTYYTLAAFQAATGKEGHSVVAD